MVKRQAKASQQENVQRRFLGLMAISNQASDDIDEGVYWAAMTSMLNLRDIFELIDDTLNDGSLTQK